MAGGSTSTNQNYNPEMQFAPNMDGGALNVGGSVFMGNANFDHNSNASGATTGMNIGLNLGDMGNMGGNMGGGAPTAPTLMLINLADLPQPKSGMGQFDYIDENTVGYIPGDQFRNAEAIIRKYVPAESINEKEWARWH